MSFNTKSYGRFKTVNIFLLPISIWIHLQKATEDVIEITSLVSFRLNLLNQNHNKTYKKLQTCFRLIYNIFICSFKKSLYFFSESFLIHTFNCSFQLTFNFNFLKKFLAPPIKYNQIPDFTPSIHSSSTHEIIIPRTTKKKTLQQNLDELINHKTRTKL